MEGLEGSAEGLGVLADKFGPAELSLLRQSLPMQLLEAAADPAWSAIKEELRARAVAEGQQQGMLQGGLLGGLAGVLGGAGYQGLNDLLFQGGKEPALA
tara:strand:- start:235 stop:531 length:297 start_codon:yes stop_codon:yes gene_type:complete